MAEITADNFSIDVTFDPTNSTSPFSYNQGAGPQATFAPEVKHKLGRIVLKLVTSGSAIPARFASAPIQWLSELREPISTPQDFFVGSTSAQEISIVNVNSVTEQTTFHFEISVMHDGTVFTSHDPTIINTPITGGG